MNAKNVSLSTSEKINFVSNFSTMLSAGIPILETIESLLEDSKGNVKKLLETIRDDLVQGQHIYVSLSKFPKVFDKVTVNLIKASEEAGTLDTSLKDLKESLKKQAEFSDKVKSALFYPMIIFVVFTGVMLMILIFVVPRIATVFENLKVELPLPTQILIIVSHAMLTYTIPFIIGVVIVVFGGIYFYNSQKRAMLNVLTSLPYISELAKEIDLTRFTHSMYLLLNAGIPITTSLDLAQDVILRKELIKIIQNCKEVVASGRKLSEGFKTAKGVIPSTMIKITEAGEKTGTLDKSMQDVSEYLDYQVSNNLKSVTALLEPLMLVLVGILVGGMMLAIIAPIYGLISQVSPH